MKLYIGTYTKDLLTGKQTGSKGIYLCEFDDETGHLQILDTQDRSENPSFLQLSADGRLLLAVNECLRTGALDTYAVDDNDQLIHLDTTHFVGSACCYAAMAEQSGFAIAVHYLGGEVFSYLLQNGKFGPRVSTFFHQGSGPVADRQEGPHTHSAHLMPERNIAVVCDLGCDLIRFYGYVAGGILTPGVLPDIHAPAGSGPRHSEFTLNGEWLYISCELSNEVLFYRRTEHGYTLQQRLSTLPGDFAGKNTAADIHLGVDQKYLYVSNRGHNSLATYRVGVDGVLEPLAIVPCGGKTPRNFAVTQRHLLCANQDSGTVTVLPLGADGIPGQVTFQLEIPASACVELSK